MWKSEQGVEECDEALQAFFFFYYNVFIQLLALANQNHILELCLLIIYISNVFQYLNFFFFFLVGLGFELRVSCLQSRCSTT
jgi:hypothetical protein